VYFGGYHTSEGPAVDTTWIYDGTKWSRADPPEAPPARALPSLAYDQNTEQVVMFGGYDISNFLHDTWTWDGATWTRQTPAHHPAGRWDGAMANDPATGDQVLFGGSDRRDGYLG